MYPQDWTPSIGGTYQNRKAEAAAQKYGAAASAFYLLRPLRVPTVPFHLILPPQKVVFARRICERLRKILDGSKQNPSRGESVRKKTRSKGVETQFRASDRLF